MEKKYFKDLDIIRFIMCLAVLLYHIGFLKGGYLAVCVFFVLTGYLSCYSAFQKEKFSIKSYYWSRFKKIYLPFIIVVFSSLTCVSLFSHFNWISLKPETTSVLFGYNNFWQINANLDYFARHIDSPFMHFWYIAILLQFEIVFPFVFLLFKKIADKTKPILPCILLILISFTTTIYFYCSGLSMNFMNVYYGSLTRLFSILYGVTFGFLSFYYPITKPVSHPLLLRILFYLFIIIFIGFFLFLDSSSIYLSFGMVFISLLSIGILYLSILNSKTNLNILDKMVHFISNISYEVYLIQYPVIFLFQDISFPSWIKITLIILITFLLSFVLHYSLSIHKKKKESHFQILQYIFCMIWIGLSLFGFMKYLMAKDYTKEMKDLEKQMSQNSSIMELKKKEYENKAKEAQEQWNSVLNDLEQNEGKLTEIVSQLPVVGVGDSIMLGAVGNLYEKFPNGYFDAKVSRTDYEANGILQSIKSRGLLSDNIVINLGANGQCGNRCRMDILRTCDGKRIFWVNVTNDADVHVNAGLQEFANTYDNVFLIDWDSVSHGHPEYFVADGIHLSGIGRKVYTDTVFDTIYQVYLEEYNHKKEEILQKHNEEFKQTISFYGNDLLINSYSQLISNFQDANYHFDSEYTFDSLIHTVENDIQNHSMNYKVVFILDSSFEFQEKKFQKLLELLKDYEVYWIQVNGTVLSTNNPNIKIIDFSSILQSNPDYLMVDKIHLTSKGNVALSQIIQQFLPTEQKET